jgi:parallel beta-helix repeat protein
MGLSLNIQIVKASGTIYIRADGSIDPPTAPIQRVADVYTFTDDIYNKSIAVQIDDITLDGNGHLLCGPTTGKHMGFGIHLQWTKNVTITNIVISNSHAYSIFLDESSNCRIINNSILSIDCMWGIRLVDSYHNFLTNNTVMNTYKAIELISSRYNTLSNNEVMDNTHGIWLNAQYHPSTGNTLRNNVMIGNKHSFLVYSHFHFMSGYINDVDTSNTVDGKPIYYWINRHDESVPLDAGCVVIVNSSRINVKDLKLRNTATGVCLAYTENSVIENVTATVNYCGIDLQLSRYNVITKNNLTDNDGPGIFLHRSNHNNLTDNFVQNTNTSGIWLEDCGGGGRGGSPGYNTLIGNTVLYSRADKPQEWDGAGILVDDSTYCKVIDNNVTNNSFGIVIGASHATNNQISGNNIVMNDVGLMLGGCVYNAIFNNNFIDNKLQVDTGKGMWKPGHNTLDSGYPSGGNYWSDYSGVDMYSGPYQNETGFDWIGDIPYLIDENNQDNYPLLHSFIPEMEEIRMAYRSLLIKYAEIHSDLNALNSTCIDLQGQIDDLQEQVGLLNLTLQVKIDSLNSTLQMSIDDLQEQVNLLNSTLQEGINSLNSTTQTSINNLREDMMIEMGTLRNLMYGFIAAIVILITITVYLAIRKPKMKP